MIVNSNMEELLYHRQGFKRMGLSKIRYQKKALELNKNSDEMLTTFGKQEIYAFTGFIDLIEFSIATKGMKAAKIKNYLTPFLESLINFFNSMDCLIDKTIGDEIMFIFVDRFEDGDAPASLRFGQLLGELYSLYKNSLNLYPSRLGLSYGKIYIDRIKGNDYSEWTAFGEPIHLAKRLHSLKQLKQMEKDNIFSAAFGILYKEENAFMAKFDVMIEQLAGNASQFRYDIIPDPEALKGISNYKCAVIYPKTNYHY